MTKSLKISEKEGRTDHLQFNIYHMVEWILRYSKTVQDRRIVSTKVE